MFSTSKLLRRLKHDLDTQIPDKLWKQLYLQLSQLVAPIGHSRYTILIVKILPYYGDITIENGLHEKLLTIPQSIDSIKQVKLTSYFNHLPIGLQNSILDTIKKTITQANELRKKREHH